MSAQPLNLFDVNDYTQSRKGAVVGNYAANTKQVEYVFDVATGTDTGEDDSIQVIPAGAVIEACDIYVVTTLAGGTEFDLGLSEPDGSVIAADGLDNGATATTGYVAGTGTLIGTQLPADAQVTLGGNRTSGVLKVVVTYKVA